jgi:hypothetical protein
VSLQVATQGRSTQVLHINVGADDAVPVSIIAIVVIDVLAQMRATSAP